MRRPVNPVEGESAVLYEVRERVCLITLNRPEKGNALNDPMRAGLFAALRRFDADRGADVAILRSRGEDFCTGADAPEMAAARVAVPDPDSYPHAGRNVAVGKPTISQVQGPALAGGFLFAMMCDLCVASERASFAISEVRRGRGAPWAAPLTRMLPQRAMAELLLTGEPMSARRAYELGFVNRVVPAAELEATTLELAGQIMSAAPRTVLAGLRLARAAGDVGTEAGWLLGHHLYEHAYRGADALEGPRALAEGREPRWEAPLGEIADE